MLLDVIDLLNSTPHIHLMTLTALVPYSQITQLCTVNELHAILKHIAHILSNFECAYILYVLLNEHHLSLHVFVYKCNKLAPVLYNVDYYYFCLPNHQLEMEIIINWCKIMKLSLNFIHSLSVLFK